ncbi:AAA family ATPase [Marininema halotolerans]|uniref:Nuclease SbcCD subunit C n=1 Tax=Marininema halotolerans TaxID=1155944 RepID=A0A1I6R695_9BACL|nr:AAA family ATPase [Marininema halotolerans]SFS60179.1 exonuclease SbcC [Marininema halotolerans]
MKGFKHLLIENFQSHERTEIDFAKGLNVFVGPSDSGKSAILRALRWLLYNQPKGKDYIRVGKERCRVSLTLMDGTLIVRERSASINRYTVTPQGEEAMVFEGFGGQVPLEVMEAHGMHPLKLDTDWNMPAQFGTQLEAPFLLSETGGVKAKSIGRVSGAHLIDIALQGTVRDMRSLSSEMKHDLEEANRLKESLTAYDDLPHQIDQLEKTEQCYRQASELQQRLEGLQSLRQRLLACQKRIESERTRLKTFRQLSAVESMVASFTQNHERVKHMERMAQIYPRTLTEIRDWQRVLQETAQCELLERKLMTLEKLAHQKGRMEKVLQRREFHYLEKKRVQNWLHLTEASQQIDLVTLEGKEQHQMQLVRLLPRLRQLQGEKRQLQQHLRQTRALPESEMVELVEGYRRLKSLRQRAQDLQDRRSRIAQGIAYKTKQEQHINEYIEGLSGVLAELGRCPTCGSEVDGSVVEHIVKEYQGGMRGETRRAN